MEAFRTDRRAVWGPHPTVSFAAIGADAARLVTPHDLRPQFGDSSPVSRLYEAMVAAVDFATPWFAAHRGRGAPAPHGASGPT